MQDGGYVKEQERVKMQDEQVRTTIENNNRGKLALVLSFISMLIALAALVLSNIAYFKPHA